MFCLADGPDSAVRVTTSAPSTDASDSKIVSTVSDEAVARSAVLSSIAEAGGDALLPSSVRLAGFNIWRKFGYNDQNMKISRLCIGCKVADALDDRRISEWTERLIDRILSPSSTDKSCTCNKSSCKECDAFRRQVSGAVTQLPATLQHRLFQNASRRLDNDTISHLLLEYFSPNLHPSILTSSISPQRSLTVVLSWQHIATLLFKALSALKASKAPILALHLVAGDDLFEKPKLPQNASISGGLSVHTGLTALSLNALDPPFVQCLARALPALRNIKQLTLGTAHDPFYPDALRHLKGRLQQLRSLQSLSITLFRCWSDRVYNIPSPGTCFDDYYGCYHYGEHSPDKLEKAWDDLPCLSQFLSGLASLTFLHLSQGGAYMEASRQLSLPELRELSLGAGWPIGMATDLLLQYLQAPVTSLRLFESNCSTLDADEVPESGLPLFARLPRCRALRRVEVDVPRSYGAYGRYLWHKAIAKQLPPALAALPALCDLVISADSPLMLRAVHAVASRLEALAMTCRFPGDKPGPQRAEWEAMYARVRMPHLMSLSLSWTENVEAGSMPGIGRLLKACPALQSLTVQQYRCCFTCEADVAVLGRLTALSTLHLEGTDTAVALHAPLAAALRPLTALQVLALSDCCLSDTFARPFAEAVRAWPSLQRLTLGCSQLKDAAVLEQVVRAVAGVPGFKELVLASSEWGKYNRTSYWDEAPAQPAFHGNNDGDSESGADTDPLLPSEAESEDESMGSLGSIETVDGEGSEHESTAEIPLDQDRCRCVMQISKEDVEKVAALAAELQVKLSWGGE